MSIQDRYGINRSKQQDPNNFIVPEQQNQISLNEQLIQAQLQHQQDLEQYRRQLNKNDTYRTKSESNFEDKQKQYQNINKRLNYIPHFGKIDVAMGQYRTIAKSIRSTKQDPNNINTNPFNNDSHLDKFTGWTANKISTAVKNDAREVLNRYTPYGYASTVGNNSKTVSNGLDSSEDNLRLRREKLDNTSIFDTYHKYINPDTRDKISDAMLGGYGIMATGAFKGISNSRRFARMERDRSVKDELGGIGKLNQLDRIKSFGGRSILAGNAALAGLTGTGKAMSSDLFSQLGLLSGQGLLGSAGGLLSGLTNPWILGSMGLSMGSSILTNKRLKKITAQRKSPFEEEKKYSLSKNLEGVIAQLTSSNQLDTFQQLQLRLLMWIEGHTSVNPLIHTELEYLREEKEKGIKGSSQRYKNDIVKRGTKSKDPLTLIENTLSSFLVKYDPFTQLSNFLLMGKTPKQMLKEINGNDDTLEQDKEISQKLNYSIGEFSILNISSQNLSFKGKSWEEKMFMLASGQFDVLRLIAKETINIRTGFGFENSLFKSKTVYEGPFAFIGKTLNGILQLPGLNAVTNIAKIPFQLGGKIANIGKSMYQGTKKLLLGKEYLDLQDSDTINKKLGFYKSSQDRSVEFLGEGLPMKLEDIRQINVEQLEVQQNIFEVSKLLYDITFESLTKTKSDFKYVERQKDNKEKLVWDDISKKYLTSETAQKALENRNTQISDTRAFAFQKSILGSVLSLKDIFKDAQTKRDNTAVRYSNVNKKINEWEQNHAFISDLKSRRDRMSELDSDGHTFESRVMAERAVPQKDKVRLYNIEASRQEFQENSIGGKASELIGDLKTKEGQKVLIHGLLGALIASTGAGLLPALVGIAGNSLLQGDTIGKLRNKKQLSDYERRYGDYDPTSDTWINNQDYTAQQLRGDNQIINATQDTSSQFYRSVTDPIRPVSGASSIDYTSYFRDIIRETSNIATTLGYPLIIEDVDINSRLDNIYNKLNEIYNELISTSFGVIDYRSSLRDIHFDTTNIATLLSSPLTIETIDITTKLDNIYTKLSTLSGTSSIVYNYDYSTHDSSTTTSTSSIIPDSKNYSSYLRDIHFDTTNIATLLSSPLTIETIDITTKLDNIYTKLSTLSGISSKISPLTYEGIQQLLYKEFKELEIPVYNNDKLTKDDIKDNIIHFPFKIKDEILNELPKVSGFMAKGGSVQKDKTYVVGEKGPEIFTPQTNGKIIPNNQIDHGMSGQLKDIAEEKEKEEEKNWRTKVIEGLIEIPKSIKKIKLSTDKKDGILDKLFDWLGNAFKALAGLIPLALGALGLADLVIETDGKIGSKVLGQLAGKILKKVLNALFGPKFLDKFIDNGAKFIDNILKGGKFFKEFGDNIISKLAGISKNIFTKSIDNISKLIPDAFKSIPETISKFISEKTLSLTDNIGKIVGKGFDNVIGLIPMTIRSIPDTIGKFITNGSDNVIKFITEKSSKFGDNITKFASSSIDNLIKILPENLLPILGKFRNTLFDKFIAAPFANLSNIDNFFGTIEKVMPEQTIFGKAAGLFKNMGSKILEMIGIKSIGKLGGKGLLKSIAKKLPGGIGAVIGAGFAVQRMIDGDYTGALLELTSGLASIVPGIGTAASLGIDAYLMFRDMKEEEANPNAGPKPSQRLWASMKEWFSDTLNIALKTLPIVGGIYGAFLEYQNGKDDILRAEMANGGKEIGFWESIKIWSKRLGLAAIRSIPFVGNYLVDYFEGKPDETLMKVADKVTSSDIWVGITTYLKDTFKSVATSIPIIGGIFKTILESDQIEAQLATENIDGEVSIWDRIKRYAIVGLDNTMSSIPFIGGVWNFIKNIDTLEAEIQRLQSETGQEIGIWDRIKIYTSSYMTNIAHSIPVFGTIYDKLVGSAELAIDKVDSDMSWIDQVKTFARHMIANLVSDIPIVGDYLYKFITGEKLPRPDAAKDLMSKGIHLSPQDMDILNYGPVIDWMYSATGVPNWVSNIAASQLTGLDGDTYKKERFKILSSLGEPLPTYADEIQLDAADLDKMKEAGYDTDSIKRRQVSADLEKNAKEIKETSTEDVSGLVGGDINKFNFLKKEGYIKDTDWNPMSEKYDFTDKGKLDILTDGNNEEKIQEHIKAGRVQKSMMGGYELTDSGKTYFDENKTDLLKNSRLKSDNIDSNMSLEDLEKARKRRDLVDSGKMSYKVFNLINGDTTKLKELEEKGTVKIVDGRYLLSNGDFDPRSVDPTSIIGMVQHHLKSMEDGIQSLYYDTNNNPTIGYGHLIDPNDKALAEVTGSSKTNFISKEEMDQLFDIDFNDHYKPLFKIPGYKDLDPVRQAAMVDIAFNTGAGSSLVKSIIEAAATKNYNEIPKLISGHQYGNQNERRWKAIQQILLTGDPEPFFDEAELKIKAFTKGSISKDQIIPRPGITDSVLSAKAGAAYLSSNFLDNNYNSIGTYTGSSPEIPATLHANEVVAPIDRVGEAFFNEAMKNKQFIEYVSKNEINKIINIPDKSEFINPTEIQQQKLEEIQSDYNSKIADLQNGLQNITMINNKNLSDTINTMLPAIAQKNHQSSQTIVQDPNFINNNNISNDLDKIINNLFSSCVSIFDSTYKKFPFDSSLNISPI